MIAIATSSEAIREKLEHATDPAERIELYRELGVLLSSVDLVAALHAVREALRIARAISDEREIAISLIAVGDYHRDQYHCDQAHAHFDEAAVLIATMPGETDLRWKLHNSRALLCNREGDYVKAVETFERALEISRAAGDRANTADVLTHMAHAYQQVNDLPRAIALLEEALCIFQELRDRSGEAIVLNILGDVSKAIKDDAGALHYYHAAHDITLEIGHRLGQAVTISNLAGIYDRQGDDVRSLELSRAAVAMFRDVGSPDRTFAALVSLGGYHNRRGEYQAALECLNEALPVIESVGTGTQKAIYFFSRADVHFNLGDMDAALACLGHAMTFPATGSNTTADIYETYSQVYDSMGDARTAFRYYREATRIRNEMASEETRQALATIEKRVQMERAEKEREIYRLKSERLGMELAHKNRELASVALDLAQKSEIVRRLERTLSPFVSAVGSDAAALVRELMPQVRELVAGGAQWGIFEQQFREAHPEFVKALLGRCPALTPTEIRLCTLMRIEMSNKDLADILRSSIRTVENHRRHIRQKLGLGREANLTTFLAALG